MVWSGQGKDLYTLMIEQYDPGIREQMTYTQFTGLSDKNGKEIYEGDILRSIYQGQELIGIINWNNKKSQFGMIIESQNPMAEHLELTDKPEIIGNIFENPGLIVPDNLPRA